MKKRRFRWIAVACSLVLVASTGFGVASVIKNTLPNAKAYEITLENEEELKSEYNYGESLTIPMGTIAGERASSYIVVSPSGKVYNTASIELAELGQYTIIWYAQVSGTTVSAEKNFLVTQGVYTTSGGVSCSYEESLSKNSARSGIKVSLEPESTFYYNKPIDLTKEGAFAEVYPYFGMKNLEQVIKDLAVAKTTGDTVAETDVKNSIQYNEDARNYLITLTDCYDSSNYITIDLEWQETRRYYNFRANPAGEIAHGLRPVKTADVSSIKVGNSYYQCHYAPGQGLTSCNVAEAVNGNDYAMQLYYDVEENSVYMTYYRYTASAKVNAETNEMEVTGKYEKQDKMLVADLDNEAIYPKGTFKGFATGEVYLSISAKNHLGDKANIEIASLGGATGEEILSSQKDTTAPVIQVDSALRSMNKIARNEEVTVPDAYALDLSLPYGTKASVAVYYMYDPNKTNNIFVGLKNGKFTPKDLGSYTIIYTATDRNGNTSKEIVELQCLDSADNKAVQLIAISNAESSAGAYFTIPECTVNGLYADASALQIYVHDEDGEQLTVENGQVFLSGVMEYTITYVYETPFNTYQATTKLQGKPSDHVVISTPSLPEYFIMNASYTLDGAYAHTYTEKKPVVVPTKVAMIATDGNGKQTETEVDFNAVHIPACKTVQFKYEYGGETKLSPVVEVLDVGFGGKISMIDYFHSDADAFTKMALSSSSRYITKGGVKNATMKYINVLSLPSFWIEYYLESSYQETKESPVVECATPKALVLTLVDYYNRDNQVQLRLEKNGDKATISFNGRQVGDTTSSFMDAKTMIFYKDGAFSIGGTKFEWESNFMSSKILLWVELEGVEGQASLRISRLADRKFANGSEDKAEPALTSSQSYMGYHKLGQIITIVPIDINDILAPYLESGLKLFVFNPDGVTFATSLDGVLLDGTCPVNREYQIRLDKEGSYRIKYEYVNQNGLTKYFNANPIINNETAPILLVEGKTDGQMDYAKWGETVSIARYTVSDDVSKDEKLRTWVCVFCPSGIVREVSNGGKFYAEEKGTYTVLYSAVDETGNYTTFAYKVNVS